jgi:toxin CptA
MVEIDARGMRAAWLASSVLCAGMGCWYVMRRLAPGTLTFDGQHWWLSGQPRTLPAGRAQIALDLQFLMLLWLKAPDARAQWLWVERRADPTRWADLRRAVYSRAPTTAAAETPADVAPLGGPSSFR